MLVIGLLEARLGMVGWRSTCTDGYLELGQVDDFRYGVQLTQSKL